MRRSRLPLFLVLGGALLPGAPPGRAQPPAAAMGKITAVGGQGVRGVENGLLLNRSFGSGCELPDLPVQPFAASLGDDVELDVQLIACPPAPLPEGRCQIRIGDAVSTWIEAQEGLVKVPVPLPGLTGIYQPELHCEAGGQVLPALASRLYLTYAPPRPIVDPPEEVWYERACSWGAGLGRSATEREVLDTILSQLYQFGQHRWRYATCAIVDNGALCKLGPTLVPTGVLLCNDSAVLCKCRWIDLVRGKPPLNFADCFVYSQVLQYIAATMGIGGMVPHLTLGSYNLGFVTHATTRSLDPEFTGNLMCGERNAPCSYTFANHELRKWGDLIYDPTFGGIYHHTDELFSQSVTEVTDYGLTFEKGGACLQGPGYGGFPSYVEIREGGEPGCARFETQQQEPARFTETPPTLLQRTSDQLVVQVEVAILTQGTYVVSGELYENDGKTPVTQRSHHETVKAPTQTTVSGSPGEHKVDLIFSSEDVARSGYLGPYRLTARLSADATGPPLDTLRAASVSGVISSDELVHMRPGPARLGNPSEISLEWVSGSDPPVLLATIPMLVRVTAPYGIDARLSRGETTLAYGGGQVELATGAPPLQVALRFTEVPAPGTYDLAVSLHWLDPLSPLNAWFTTIQLPPLPASAQRR
ncbi:MAG: hypothetical protein ACJ76J_04820 [Thermoanaerobaculia bacterium]